MAMRLLNHILHFSKS
jgi:26S proteasome regulatory subunit N1